MHSSFNIENKVFDLTQINPLIVKYKVAIASADTIANGFYFSKDVLSSLFDTVKGSPVLTYCDPSTGKFAGHEGDLYKSKNGLKRTPELSPIGFTSYDEAGVFWENLNLDGEDKDWMCACVYLWKDRYPFTENLLNQTANQSMELELNFKEENGIKYVTEAQFSGIALIGIEPAFSGSKFLSFSKQDYSTQVEKLKKELNSLNKYNDVDFSIPNNIKDFSLKATKENQKITSVCKSNLDYLSKNDYVSPEKVSYIQRYFSKQNRKTFSINGDEVIVEWCNKLINQMKIVDENGSDDMKNFSKEEFKKDEIGSGDYTIKVDKSKDSVSNDAWGDVDKTALMHKVLKSKNATTLVKDIYLVVEDGWQDAPSQHLKYPVMQIKGDTAVYNSDALSSALAYANNPDRGDSEVASKVKKIQKKLGLLKDSQKEGDKENMAKFTKTQKEEFATKFSISANQMISMMNDLCSSQTFDTDNGTRCKYWIFDFDDTYMYGYDEQNGGNVAIPFGVADDNSITPDFENVKVAKCLNVWVVEDSDDFDNTEDDNTYMSAVDAKCAKVEEMCNTKLSEVEAKLTDTEAKLGAQFASTTSLETALADEKAANEERQKQIEELSAELKKMSDEAKGKEVDTLMSKKEFSVFDDTKKEELKKMSLEKSYDEFKTLVYAELGKFASMNLEFDAQNGKFSYMYTQQPTDAKKESEKDDVYAQARQKLGKENK